jgi:hypothetical protein
VRFPKENTRRYRYGDHRVLQRFALFPHRVADGQGSIYTILWERYDVVQKYYMTVGWRDVYCLVLGAGRKIATENAKIYEGRFTG